MARPCTLTSIQPNATEVESSRVQKEDVKSFVNQQEVHLKQIQDKNAEISDLKKQIEAFNC
jgi:hypothetical protein